MQVFLDDQPCDVLSDSVLGAVADAAALVERNGRMIVEVRVDGSQWTNLQLGSPESATTTADRVELVTADPVELVRDTLVDAREALDEAASLQRTAAEHVQADDMEQAMSRLDEAVDIWIAVHDAVIKSVGVVDFDLDDVRVDQTSAQEAIDQLAQRLSAVRDALTQADPVSLSDTLLYDLPRVVDLWQAMLAELQGRLPDCK